MKNKLKALEKLADLVLIRNHLMLLLDTSRGLLVKGDSGKVAAVVRDIDKELLSLALADDSIFEDFEPGEPASKTSIKSKNAIFTEKPIKGFSAQEMELEALKQKEEFERLQEEQEALEDEEESIDSEKPMVLKPEEAPIKQEEVKKPVKKSPVFRRQGSEKE